KDSDDSAILSLATQDNCNYQWENYSVVLTDKTNNQLAITGSDNVGIYSITATVTSKLVSEGCVARSTNPVVITINPKASKPIIEEKTNNTLFCPGTEVELNVKNYSNTVNYQWKYYGVVIDGANNQVYKGKLAAGDYSVEAEPGSCATESDKITLKHKLALSKPTILGHGPTVWILACDNMTATNYRWYYNNNLIPGANKYQYVANKNYGDYYVTVNDGGECWTPSDVFKVDLTNGIDDLANDNIKIYPNPSKGIINISIDKDIIENVTIEIFDVLGKTIHTKQAEGTSYFKVNLSGYANGVYYLRIKVKNEIIVKRIVKQ
ncbi:MAG TPA: T9SS type A sorting domain-containing protein, partial [Tenuifilaceae bacterium]|nr:T9SS type A sorting domain-containing protein [Tenuifilaceae bacterium]